MPQGLFLSSLEVEGTLMLRTVGSQDDAGEPPMAVCVLDNRGVGRSSSPAGWKNYTTEIMAGDVLTLMVGVTPTVLALHMHFVRYSWEIMILFGPN